MRVLLTGATGFVGRQILAELTARGSKVRAIVRDPKDLPQETEIVVSPDIFSESEAWWLQQMDGIDRVIHAAWYVEPGAYQLSLRNLDCLQGSLTLLKAFLSSDVPHWTGLGTCFEYAFQTAPLTTEDQLAPQTPYAACKVSLGLTAVAMAEAAGKRAAWCRLFYLHGEGEHPARLFPMLHTALARGETLDLTSGHQVRDYMDVAEAGRQIVSASLGKHQGMANICTGTPRTVRNIAQEIAALYGAEHLLNFGARPENPSDPPFVVGIPTFQALQRGRP
ncbi:NAD-dependent epimerase/dehydratase family protein [Pseudogemmobacter sp. W21_MBD1_M6]|uniref:NAD-dependent epimerase/dehydratase family protein n=1 Tax=Pseudogemmobacter sp. W21_MBD1_M6 TaxID=3240271 RepID=UPI003F94C415